jgi:CspA family cold shock protein
MPIRIYDIAKKLGLDNKDVLAKAKDLGIAAAKVPSSHLDKISAEWLEEEIIKTNSVVAARFAPKPVEEPRPVVEGKIQIFHAPPPKPQITITATGAELYQLVERILGQEIQFCLNISKTEQSEPLRLCLNKDASQKTSDTTSKLTTPIRVEVDERTKDLLRAAYFASRHNSTDGWVNLAEYGGAIKKVDPTFQPHIFGERGLGSLLRRVNDMFELRNDESNPIVYFVRMKEEKPRPFQPVPTQKTEAPAPSSGKLARGKIHNLRLGFGFIMPDDGSENLFFHATDVEACTIFDLKPGDPVEYEYVMSEKGPCARKVRRLE